MRLPFAMPETLSKQNVIRSAVYGAAALAVAVWLRRRTVRDGSELNAEYAPATDGTVTIIIYDRDDQRFFAVDHNQANAAETLCHLEQTSEIVSIVETDAASFQEQGIMVINFDKAI